MAVQLSDKIVTTLWVVVIPISAITMYGPAFCAMVGLTAA